RRRGRVGRSKTGKKTTPALRRRGEFTSPFRVPCLNSRYWTPAINTPSGRKSKPIPKNSRRWPKYIRRDAATIEPQARRCSRWKGADGGQSVREGSQRSNA